MQSSTGSMHRYGMRTEGWRRIVSGSCNTLKINTCETWENTFEIFQNTFGVFSNTFDVFRNTFDVFSSTSDTLTCRREASGYISRL